MHGPPLSSPSVAVSPERAAAAALAAEHEELLVLLTTLRAASGDALCALYFDAKLARRAAFRRLKALTECAVLARQELTDHRSVYRLAGAALSLSARVRARVSDAARKPLSDDDASYCWLRSALWAELKKQGFEIGRGPSELLALRRFLVDTQVKRSNAGDQGAGRVLAALRSEPTLTPLFRSRCKACRWQSDLRVAVGSCPSCNGHTEQVLSERRFACSKCGHVADRAEEHGDGATRPRRTCSGTMREADHLPFDVAWRTTNGVREVLLVFVDDPGCDLVDQLRELPLRVAGQPRVPIVLRTTDIASIYSRETGSWTSKGERHRALLRAFSDDGDKHSFPFSTTAKVVDVCPQLQLRLSHNRPRKVMSHA